MKFFATILLLLLAANSVPAHPAADPDPDPVIVTGQFVHFIP